MYTCIKLFLRPPLTQCYFCQFYRNFDKLWIIHKKLDTGNRNLNGPYWISRAQEKSLGLSSSRIWCHNSSRRYMCVKCFAILYCMADDVLKQTMYWKAYKELHNGSKWVREGCTIPVPIIVLYL